MLLFNITYEIVTQESAEYGDAAERGFIAQDLPFRDAIELFNSERDGGIIEADSSLISADFAPRWFTAYGEMQNATGDCKNISLHLPRNISGHSAMRIARLINCYGVR